MDRIEFDDIQGLIIRGYKELPFARFLLLEMSDVAAARGWLARVRVTPASDRDHETATNLAFTSDGLGALGLPGGELDAFSLEFREGMSKSAQRNRALGDLDRQAPESWIWGRPTDSIHAVLLLYARTATQLQALDEAANAEIDAAKIRVARRLETHTLSDGDGFRKYWFREHFGFRDGVAQPRLALHPATAEELRRGIAQASQAENLVRAGEFVFGYPNEYGGLPDGGGPDALAKNGSFLVFRQLEQDVFGFWQFIREKARQLDCDPIFLASKMVGRWPTGAPLVKAARTETAGLEQFDAFGYRDDPKGHACPASSHVRRANPRDGLFADPSESLRISNRHRLVRRGRPYGEPIDSPLDPSSFLPNLDALEASKPKTERGLHFLCFNTNIRRQFEFVQQTWANNPKFAEQHNGPDPIIGPNDGGEFQLPGDPARRQVTPLKSFVRGRGGAYFFMPGLRALSRLAGVRQ